MAPIRDSHADMRTCQEVPGPYSGSLSAASEPVFIHPLNGVSGKHSEQVQASSSMWGTQHESPQKKTYCPGEMLSKSALDPIFNTPPRAGLLTDAMWSPGTTAFETYDPEAVSDCSTTDSSTEAMSSMHMAMADVAVLPDVNSVGMIPSLGMASDTPWPNYSTPYWMQPCAMPTHPCEPCAMPIQPSQGWSQPSAGSTGHRVGRCKPCAFLYKEGCLSGADCQYCHLCPPGEKQRRKRVMRAMQRNLGHP